MGTNNGVQVCLLGGDDYSISQVHELKRIQAILTPHKAPFDQGSLVRCRLAKERWVVEGDLAHILQFGVVLKYLEPGKVLIGQKINDSLKTRVVEDFCLEWCMPDTECYRCNQHILHNLTTVMEEYRALSTDDTTMRQCMSPMLPRLADTFGGPSIVFPTFSGYVSRLFELEPDQRIIGQLKNDDSVPVFRLGIGKVPSTVVIV